MPCLHIAVAFTVVGVVVALFNGVRSVLDRDVVVATRRGGRGGIQSVALQPVSSMEHVRSVADPTCMAGQNLSLRPMSVRVTPPT